jgi:hypothetical protein
MFVATITLIAVAVAGTVGAALLFARRNLPTLC